MTASAPRILSFGELTDRSLSEIVERHNARVRNDAAKATSLETAKLVYRRGAMTYSVSHREGVTRPEWAMARVQAFTDLLRRGRPTNTTYTSDNDLLPSGHPCAVANAMTASASVDQLTVYVQDRSAYATSEDAILSMTEYMGFGYEAEPAVRASWLRAVRRGDDPYSRTRMLAEHTYESPDADLLPRRKGK
jgi:hypothetical protein